MTRMILAAAAVFSAFLASAEKFEPKFGHVMCEEISLDGEWEMAYQPYAWESVHTPKFKGVMVKNAVPGYWEDMLADFRAAGMKDEFRINPWYEVQTFPITGRASDTTLPNIYGCFFYRRTVEIGDPARPALLAFEGVRNQVHVWVNGYFVELRQGFSTPFEIALPAKFLRKGANEIVLAVSNNPNLGYCDYVCGLTTRALFTSTGGVNGHLALLFPKSDIADVYVTTAKDLKTFTVHVAGKDAYSYTVSDAGKVLAKGEGRGDFTLSTAGYEFWTPENPKRYELAVTTGKGTYSQKFGIRRLLAEGEKFKLNGKPVYLRGVTEHCYFAKTVHLPRDLEYYRMITRKRKELGFNFVRFHTFVPPVEYLEATDELGMLVHMESPNFASQSEYAAIIAFARRHPSVVIYCTGNETRIDRIAEAYLNDIANMVHERTDSLFSPMSAMRGIEYILMPGLDAIEKEPFTHNPERMERVAKYSDFFTSYQLAVTSYSSLNLGSPEILDRWGDVYRGKPRTSHEICIDGSYVDFSLEKLYPADSPILKVGIFSGLRKQLQERGLFDRADTYFRNSCEWMRRVRKHCFEKLRAADRVAGYDFLGDINTHWHTFGYSVGMMDEFYRLKPGETVENVLRYNSAAVVLCDLGSDFNFTAGETRKVAFSVSNYDAPAPGAKLSVALTDEKGVKVWSAETAAQNVDNGKLSKLGEFAVKIPESAQVKKYLLKAAFAGGAVKAENEWEVYAFPVPAAPAKGDVRVVEDISGDDLLKAMAAGEKVLLLGKGPFKALKSTYRIALAGRPSGDLATVIKAGHPALKGMPHEGYCGWQFRRLMEGGHSVQLEAGVPFDPIVDVASSAKFVIRQSSLFEYRVGEGRLLVCSFNFTDADPAAKWLKSRLVEYAASGDFNPVQAITSGQLRAVLEAPLLTGAKNDNRARNPADPSSNVRAGRHARP